ncbi:MAG: IS1 family transposase [Thiotrichales bacterium]|nr:IS1 family transposase [Thiotrichales bacterium]
MNILHCPECESPNLKVHSRYSTRSGQRTIYVCECCGQRRSEMYGSPAFNLKTPMSKVAAALKLRSEGMGLRATGRCLNCSKRDISVWESRFAEQKEPLQLYGQIHQYISLTFEGDEVYTRVGKNIPAADSEGWTMVIMERSSRYLLEMECGVKEQALFTRVLTDLLSYSADDITFFSDGERRYGNTLFELCNYWSSQKNKAFKSLPPHLNVRLKNKASARKNTGKAKYETPVVHAPGAKEVIESEIHGNHVESFNAALRRKCSAMRRRSNTYAKTQKGLRRVLNVQWLMHNFVNEHFTTGVVPAVAMGFIDEPLSISQLLTTRFLKR